MRPAEAVGAFVKAGINPQRIAQLDGETKPIAINVRAEGRTANRRVEVDDFLCLNFFTELRLRP
jgi:outer membrane protein OmpA-like peptidoglycan-associated protein